MQKIGDNIEASRPCCLTRSTESKIIALKDRRGKPLRTIINLKSGLVYVDPRPEENELKAFYSSEYRKQYKGIAVPKKKHILRAGRVALSRFSRLYKYLKGNEQILDIGSGGGEFVYLLKQRGLLAKGVEANEGYANYSIEEFGNDIEIGVFQEINGYQASFDVVTLFHVLEHLPDPVSAIEKIGGYLKNGGLLAIEVPNVTYRRTFPQQKWHIGHLFSFDLKTLQAVALKAGFSILAAAEVTDGGNIMMFCKKGNGDRLDDGFLKGNFEAVSNILLSHTSFSHFFTWHPYYRPILRALKNLGEMVTVSKKETGREILDSLYHSDEAISKRSI